MNTIKWMLCWLFWSLSELVNASEEDCSGKPARAISTFVTENVHSLQPDNGCLESGLL